jgi:hypothetical protein
MSAPRRDSSPWRASNGGAREGSRRGRAAEARLRGVGQGGDCDGRLKGKVAKNGGSAAGVFGLCGLQVVFAGDSVRRGYAVLWWVIWLSAPLRLFVCTSFFAL